MAGRMAGGTVAVAAGRPNQNNNVAIGVAAQSAVFAANTRLIRVHADAICSVLLGSNPSATVSTADARMAANQTEYYQVNPGDKIGVISNV